MFTKFRMKEEKGFTLIELLIVVAIIGILAAIAIPQFGAYRKRGYNASANSDLRGMRTTEEAIMADYNDYGVTDSASQTGTGDVTGSSVTGTMYLCGAKTSTASQLVSLSPNVYAAAVVYGTVNVGSEAYVAVTSHKSGDSFYGADSRVTTIFRKVNAAFDIVTPANESLAEANAVIPANATVGTTTMGADTGWVSTQ